MLRSMRAQNFGRDKDLATHAMPGQSPQQPGDPIGDPRMACDTETRGHLLPVEDLRGEAENIWHVASV